MNRLLITGLPYFSQQIAKRLSDLHWKVKVLDLAPVTSKLGKALTLAKELLGADLWYQIGGSVGRNRIYKIAHLLNIPIVVHWVGTDVLTAVRFFKENPQFLEVIIRRATHWAGAPWLVEELEEIKIRSQFVPLPLDTVDIALSNDPPPLPDRFTVLSYLPDDRPQFYGSDYIVQLAREFQDVHFLIVGTKGKLITDKLPNVQFLGWVDNMYELYAKTTVVIRMTQHDGYGGTVQEALATGRYAIWIYPFPGALQAKDYPSLCDHIRRLINLHRKSLLRINKRGRDYMKEHMNPKVLARYISKNLRATIEEQAAGRRGSC